MAKIFFNDKQSGDSLTATNVNDIKAAINTNIDQLEADVSSLHLQDASGGSSSTAVESLSNGTVSGYYDSNNQWRYNHHLIPASNANFDLGSAEYKVRHLFLSDNSLWVGDETKIDASPEGTIQTKKRDKSKLPYYITGVLDGSESAAYSFLNVDYAEEITLKGLEEYAQSLNPNVTLSDIFPPEGSANYQESDYESKTKINQSKNQRKKIYIEYDNAILAPSIPTLDLNECTDYEFYIDTESANYLHDPMMSARGEIGVRVIPTEHDVNKFNIFISKPNNSSDYNGTLFNGGSTLRISMSNDDGSMTYRNWDNAHEAINDISASKTIEFECNYAKPSSISIPKSIYAMGTNPDDFTYTHKMTVNGLDYYWLTNNEATEALAITDQRSTNPGATPGDNALWIMLDSGAPIFWIARYNDQNYIIPDSEYTIESVQGSVNWNGNEISNANIIQNIFFGETTLLNGTLYTKYQYYGDPNRYTEDGRGAA